MAGPRARDLAGRVFGRLTAIERVGTRRRFALWRCHCVCGAVIDTCSDVLVGGHSRSCGCYAREASSKRVTGLRREQHPKWKGGRYVDPDGYVRVYIGNNKYRAEHQLVVERALGRPLDPSLVVHHKNDVKADNALDNLEPLTRSAHAIKHGFGKRIRG
jgi:hypothetical protein